VTYLSLSPPVNYCWLPPVCHQLLLCLLLLLVDCCILATSCWWWFCNWYMIIITVSVVKPNTLFFVSLPVDYCLAISQLWLTFCHQLLLWLLPVNYLLLAALIATKYYCFIIMPLLVICTILSPFTDCSCSFCPSCCCSFLCLLLLDATCWFCTAS